MNDNAVYLQDRVACIAGKPCSYKGYSATCIKLWDCTNANGLNTCQVCSR